MPPPQSSRATAESVQAAVAAAQTEEWATAAHAAAWGKPFVEPLAQMGPAAWNTAFPRQVGRSKCSSLLVPLLATGLPMDTAFQKHQLHVFCFMTLL